MTTHETVSLTTAKARNLASGIRDLGYACDGVQSLTRVYELQSQRTFFHVAVCRDGKQHRISIDTQGRIRRFDTIARSRSADLH